MGRDDEAGEESDEEHEADKDGEPGAQPDMAYLHENVAETTVAVDPVHHVGPVRMMQALQGTLQALHEQAARIARNEKTPTVADSNGALQPVADEGGRHAMSSMVLDVQSAARTFDERAKVVMEQAHAGADACRVVGPQSLSVPTQRPLSSYVSRSWPACYTEFWFGDGAPNLERERPMLFEQVARRIVNLEELEYALETDEEPYEAACQSRFSSPEIVAVLGDVIRRLRASAGPALTLIGVGGIDSAEIAWERITAGASLIQLYTGWIFQGPDLVPRILEGLQLQVDRHGLRSIAEAVGSGLPWLAGSEDAEG